MASDSHVNDPHYNTSKAARWLGLPERTVRHLCAKERLEGAWQPSGYAGKWLIPEKTLRKIRPTPADRSLLEHGSL